MAYTYDAFISYRHLPADMAVAEKLQKLLESRKKKDGTKLTVFRDRSDLPTTSDLGADIRDALEHSRFLIVLCSRSYQQSKWCMKELEYFRQLHGGNAHILPILLEGEPEEVFPQSLRCSTKTVLDEQGNPTTVQMEIEPLGADVRANSIPAQLKKLRVEYLRIAAPILGVSFDQLYQRSQRRKRAITAAVIAALAAFAVYSIILITQITQRQKQLEAKQEELIAKQQELYQNESVRLANEAMLLAADNPPLAMLLTNAALPADLSNPDYPLTPEAELSARSIALQHQFEEASAFFTLKASIPFDNSDWTIGKFYENGKYFTVFDYSKTWLYEAHTGMMITTLPGVGYYFFDGIAHCGNELITTDADGQDWYGYAIYDTVTGAELGSVEGLTSVEKYRISPLYDRESEKLWIVGYTLNPQTNLPEHCCAFGWFQKDGTFREDTLLPDSLAAHFLEQGPYLYSENPYIYDEEHLFCEYSHYYFYGQEGYPEEYQKVADAFNADFNYSYSLSDTDWTYGITKTPDGCLYLIQYYYWPSEGAETTGTAFWAAQENRLLLTDETRCFYESDTKLIYRLMDDELQILEANPENFDLPLAPPVFQYTSEDGVFGFAYHASEWEKIVTDMLFAYDTAKLKDVVYHKEEGVTYISEAGDCQYAQPSTLSYSVTPDGTRMAYHDDFQDRIRVVDVAAGDSMTWMNLEGVSFVALTISTDGTRVAYAEEWEDGYKISIADPDVRKYVGSFYLHNVAELRGYSAPRLEIHDGRLLVELCDQAFVYELDNLEAEPWVIQKEGAFNSTSSKPFSHSLTKDGLLILSTTDGWYTYREEYREYITAIYDVKTGEEIGFYNEPTTHRESYYYDSVGGNLIQRFSNSIVVQRRGESGDFEVAYTITPRHANMELHTAGHASDGTWLVLQNEEYCEIYRLEDGALCYMLRKPDSRNSQLAVIDGKLYDFCIGWQHSVSLPSTEESRGYIRQALVYEDVTRTLTDREVQDYYIPGNWREK